jgi:hypothetical protein
MSLILPSGVDTVVLPLPHVAAKADAIDAGEGRRIVYFETSREGVVDRQGEDIACEALWNSRKHFLEQGDLDIGHFSYLGNPRGIARPEYTIGLPRDVRRQGKSIWVAGEVFSPTTPPPEGSNGWWADTFWHSLTQLRPAKRWFPSVLGRMPHGAVELQVRGGRTVRFIKGPLIWFSVGFANRAQHPALGPVGSSPMGPFEGDELIAKAMASPRALVSGSVAYFNVETFAKAVHAAQVVTAGEDGALAPKGELKGTAALRREALEGSARRTTPKQLYKRLKPKVLRGIVQGTVEGTLEAVASEFKRLGAPERLARAFARQLGTWADDVANRTLKRA